MSSVGSFALLITSESMLKRIGWPGLLFQLSSSLRYETNQPLDGRRPPRDVLWGWAARGQLDHESRRFGQAVILPANGAAGVSRQSP